MIAEMLKKKTIKLSELKQAEQKHKMINLMKLQLETKTKSKRNK